MKQQYLLEIYLECIHVLPEMEGYKIDVVEENPSDHGGYKEISFSVQGDWCV